MTRSYYDAIVLGAQLAPLTCAALLAKRGFRVLVLGQGDVSPDYTLGELRLPRQPFTFVANGSPVAQRVMSELGMSQTLRRMSTPVDPPLQFAMPGHRFDLPTEPGKLEAEVDRNFPEVKRPILDLQANVRELLERSDELVAEDLMWPPETFAERRAFGRASASLPFERGSRARTPLSEFPNDHPFRVAMQRAAQLDADLELSPLPPLAAVRLLGGRQRGAAIEGGLASLRRLLVERIIAHSGEVRLTDRAQQITVRRSEALGVRLFGSGDEIGGTFVVVGVPLATLQRLLADRAPIEELFERFGEPQPRYYRYTLNAVLAPHAVPSAMGRDLILLGKAGSDQPTLHVQKDTLPDDRILLTVQALLPARGVEEQDEFLEQARAEALDLLRELLPFLDDHLQLLDSPHDRKQPWTRDGGSPPAVDPGDRRGPSTMRAVHAFPVTSTLGVCAMPVRTPLRGLLLCNDQVVPGLGIEGKLLVARAAASLVTRSDRAKPWIRRRLWTKVEF